MFFVNQCPASFLATCWILESKIDGSHLQKQYEFACKQEYRYQKILNSAVVKSFSYTSQTLNSPAELTLGSKPKWAKVWHHKIWRVPCGRSVCLLWLKTVQPAKRRFLCCALAAQRSNGNWRSRRIEKDVRKDPGPRVQNVFGCLWSSPWKDLQFASQEKMNPIMEVRQSCSIFTEFHRFFQILWDYTV